MKSCCSQSRSQNTSMQRAERGATRGRSVGEHFSEGGSEEGGPFCPPYSDLACEVLRETSPPASVTSAGPFARPSWASTDSAGWNSGLE